MSEEIDITWDIEANSLLNENSIDYSASPFRLKEDFTLHCLVVEEHGGDIIAFYDGPKYELDGRPYHEKIFHKEVGEHTYVLENYQPVEYIHMQLKEFPNYLRKKKIRRVIGHNQINYDLLVAKLWYGLDYTIGPDTWDGKPVHIEDTMVLSKTLNPDRFEGHSLDALSAKTGIRKVNFRPELSKDKKFFVFAADMLYYNIYDCKSNTAAWRYLEKERGTEWDWSDAIALEKAVLDIITRQEHRGFKFDKDLAVSNIQELDAMMQEKQQKIEPILPPRPATQVFLKEHTAPVNQFVKSGALSAHMEKFIKKHDGEILAPRKVRFYGVDYDLPLTEPLKKEMAAKIGDTTHIKNWLVGLGWQPLEYKEKDLSVDTKKQKLSMDKFHQTVKRYVDQTLESNFCKDRCDFLKTTPEKLLNTLLGKFGKGCKVITNPSFTVGQEKNPCPNLLAMSEQFPYALDIIEYMTYRHRRNSILGGGADWDDDEEPEKGFLSSIRGDGRIPTPAGTCDAATSRMKHRLVANVPRVTSLYGSKMRALFGVDRDTHFQIGYDFASLEARMESHYCWKYDEAKEYCESLLLEKPRDVHTITALKISAIIGRPFARSTAKNVKYGCTYGAQEAKVAKTIGADLKTGKLVFDAFWEAAGPLKELRDKLKIYWESVGFKRFILGIDGRKVPTRSAHAILNSLFQSAGVICAKRAMVIHDQKLKQHGLWVDFFKEDWKNKLYCQQLIAYHDEAQLEVSKKLMKFKTFSWEQLGRQIFEDKDKQAQEDSRCKAVVEEWRREQRASTGEIWSEVQKSPKGGFFVAYCKPGHLVVESVIEAGEYYNLNVPLAADYCVGLNWKDCH